MDDVPRVILNYIISYCDTKSLINLTYLSKKFNKEAKKVSSKRITDRFPNFFDKNLYKEKPFLNKLSRTSKSPQYYRLMQKDIITKDNERCSKQNWYKDVDWIFAVNMFEKLNKDLTEDMNTYTKEVKELNGTEEEKEVVIEKKSQIMAKILANIIRESAKDKKFPNLWKNLIYNTKWNELTGKTHDSERKKTRRIVQIKIKSDKVLTMEFNKKIFPSNNYHDSGCRKISLKCNLGETTWTFSCGIKQSSTMSDLFLTSDSEIGAYDNQRLQPNKKVLEKLEGFSQSLFGLRADYVVFCKFAQLVFGKNKCILKEIESRDCLANKN
eukprot:TRINITY_DN9125_c0_g1_i1.p1 TRINITY_DN9125_c0_g1~~TRINITY_DN9125_c0_g1_i1.p1  ORF type:complete len:326 (+),score=64.09 TRINITY_DN9125_c0_g1_i1:42-1019(+)